MFITILFSLINQLGLVLSGSGRGRQLAMTLNVTVNIFNYMYNFLEWPPAIRHFYVKILLLFLEAYRVQWYRSGGDWTNRCGNPFQGPVGKKCTWDAINPLRILGRVAKTASSLIAKELELGELKNYDFGLTKKKIFTRYYGHSFYLSPIKCCKNDRSGLKTQGVHKCRTSTIKGCPPIPHPFLYDQI